MATERRWPFRAFVALGVLGLAGAAACSASSNDSASGVFGGTPVLGIGGSGNSSVNVGAGNPADAGTLPPETETDQTFRAPVATGRVLWTSNPDSGRVALIDAQTLKVRMTNAGFGPTYLAAIPTTDGSNAAIVLNTGSHDASFIRATDAAIDVTSVATNTGDNAWSVSDDGHFAIAWTDASQIQGAAPDPTDGFSELTVIDLSVTPPVGTRLSVGFRPSQVVFDAKKQHAFAVVDEGISVIDLSAAPLVTNLISLTNPGTAARDVNISKDGSFAVVRVDGSKNVDIVDLSASDGAIQSITLESDPTDLDLSSDSKTATAVLGNASPPKIVSFTVPTPGSNLAGEEIAGELVRSVTLTPNDDVAVLYVDAVPSNHITLLDTKPGDPPTYRTVDLKSPVQRVYVSPDSSTAITFQAAPSGSMKKGLFSAVPTAIAADAVRPPKIVGTDALPQDVAFSDAKTGKALVTVYDSVSAVHGVYIVGLANLEQNFISLASQPLPGASGFVPDVHVGFVAQQHPEGRITFINLDTGVTQTLTGFEIAARVVQ